MYDWCAMSDARCTTSSKCQAGLSQRNPCKGHIHELQRVDDHKSLARVHKRLRKASQLVDTRALTSTSASAALHLWPAALITGAVNAGVKRALNVHALCGIPVIMRLAMKRQRPHVP